MEVTQVRVFPVDEEKLKAFVSIILDECFVVSDIKIIQGASGLFVSMPSKKRKNGTFRDVAHPLNNETRNHIEGKIIAKYREVVQIADQEDGMALRQLDDGRERDFPSTAVASAEMISGDLEEPNWS
jgi:stage V sporulation protein G